LTDDDFALMGRTNWSADLAARLVGLLEKQRIEFARREQELLDQEEARIQARRRQELAENATITGTPPFPRCFSRRPSSRGRSLQC